MGLRRWGLSKNILHWIIKANVVGVSTFLSIVSFWSVQVTAELLWLPISTLPISILPVAVFYALERHRCSDAREQGSYLISMMLGNIGTLAGLCAYVLFGAVGFAYVQLIAVPQILIIVLFCFPMSQYYYDKWANHGEGKKMEIHLLRLLCTWNQLPAVGVVIGLTLAGLGVENPQAVTTLFTILIHAGAWMGMVPVGNEMKAIQQKWFASFDEFIDHKDEIRYYDVGDGAALAEYLICEENIFGEIPHELQKHIDYHSYGNELEMDDRYLFTTSGVFRYQ